MLILNVPHIGSASLDALDHVVHRVDKIENAHLQARSTVLGHFKFLLGRQARVDILLRVLQRFQLVGGVLEFLVLHQLADQFPAGILAFLLFLRLHLLFHRQEFLALDVHERAGHHEEFAGDLDIKLAHEIDVLDEFPRDLGEVYLIDVHLLLLHQVKQKIHGALEHLEFDFIIQHEREPQSSPAPASRETRGCSQWTAHAPCPTLAPCT